MLTAGMLGVLLQPGGRPVAPTMLWRAVPCAGVFWHADLTPAAHRATASHAKALNAVIQPCLAHPLQLALSQIRQLFPPAAACMAQTAAAATAGGSNLTTNSSSRGLPKAGSNSSSSSRHAMHIARPRMLLVGPPGSGQQQLGAAVLAAVEGLPVHCIGLTSLLANVAARCALLCGTLHRLWVLVTPDPAEFSPRCAWECAVCSVTLSE